MKKHIKVIITGLILSFTIIITAAAFIDVPEGAYYAEAAERMNKLGILTGYGDDRYNGEENITRAQMAVVAVRLLGKEVDAKAMAGETAFTDFTPGRDDWATGYVNFVAKEGIMIGDGDNIFRPNDSIKYEEVIKIVVCVLGLDEGVKIDPSDWSKEYLEAAEKANLLGGLIGKKGEPMKRSDIAVVCSASIDVLESKAEETEATTTANKPTGGTTVKPVVTTAPATTEVPVETTAVPEPEVTTSEAPKNDNPYADFEMGAGDDE